MNAFLRITTCGQKPKRRSEMDWTKIQKVALGLLRQGLGAGGSILVAKGIGDAAVLDSVIGLVMAAAGFGFGVVTKTTMPGQIWSVARTALTAVAAVAVFQGWVTESMAGQIVTAVAALIGTGGSMVHNKIEAEKPA